MTKYLLPFFALIGPLWAMAQPTTLPIGSQGAYLVDRLDIMHPGASPIHTDLRGYSRKDAAHMALALDSSAVSLDARDRRDLQYLALENNEWISDTSHFRHANKPFLKIFYPTPANLIEVNSRYFSLRANPMFNFQGGKEQDVDGIQFMNQRGLEVRGTVDQKAFFYTNLVETQARFADYVTDRIQEKQAIPGAGFYQDYTSSPFNITNGYDFNVATAYIGFQLSKHVGMRFGHGQHFIGNGYRSVLLSDYANPAFFLQINTRVWRLHYQNLFLELSPLSQRQIPAGTLLPKKYAAIHYLSFNASKRFTIGIFEATVLNRSRQFEFQYLNPVIFYRTVEGMLGSPDNAMLGCNASYNLLNTIQLYGQFLLDEFTFSEFFNNKGYWANKYSIQAGGKYLNVFGVSHLDLQAEYNSTRPYTYSHYDIYNSYTHYNQPLAHPQGANFREFVGIVRYQPTAKLFLSLRAIHTITGENTPTENWGGDPLLTYNSRVQNYGNAIGQGVGATINLLGFDASWMLYHNLFVDFKAILRKKDSQDDARDQSDKLFSIGLRMNMWNQNLDF